MRPKNAIDWHTRIASELEQRYETDRSFIERRRIWEALIDRYSGPEKTAFDVGCGTGIFSSRLAGKNRRAFAIDASAEMLRICRERNLDAKNLAYHHGDIATLRSSGLPKADLIICSSVIEYVADFEAAIDQLCGLLDENGIIAISMPNVSSLFRKLEPFVYRLSGRPRYYEFVNLHSRNELEAGLERNRVEVVDRVFYGRTPLVSGVLRRVARPRFSETLVLVVGCRRRSDASA